jgi:hypothetical protein
MRGCYKGVQGCLRALDGNCPWKDVPNIYRFGHGTSNFSVFALTLAVSNDSM